MALSRSQFTAMVGGASIIVAPFLPIIRMDDESHTLLGAGRDLDLLSVLGFFAIVYGATVILFSVWWSTGRHFILPSALGLLATVFGALITVGTGDFAPAWGAFFAGHLFVSIAGLIDRRQYREFVRGGKD